MPFRNWKEKVWNSLLELPLRNATEEGIFVAKGEEEPREIKAGTVVWAAGIRGNSIIEKSGFEAMRGRVKIQPDLRVPGFEDIFMIGDSSLMINEEINRPYPPTAQIAMQQGEVCARNIAALVRNKSELETFTSIIKGLFARLVKMMRLVLYLVKKLPVQKHPS